MFCIKIKYSFQNSSKIFKETPSILSMHRNCPPKNNQNLAQVHKRPVDEHCTIFSTFVSGGLSTSESVHTSNTLVDSDYLVPLPGASVGSTSSIAAAVGGGGSSSSPPPPLSNQLARQSGQVSSHGGGGGIPRHQQQQQRRRRAHVNSSTR